MYLLLTTKQNIKRAKSLAPIFSGANVSVSFDIKNKQQLLTRLATGEIKRVYLLDHPLTKLFTADTPANAAGSVYFLDSFQYSHIPIVILPPTTYWFMGGKYQYQFFQCVRKFNEEKYWVPPKLDWTILGSETDMYGRVGWKQLAFTSLLISFDIETLEKHKTISVVGFSFLLPDFSIKSLVVPFDKENYELVKTILQNEVPKVAQNGRYDTLWLMRFGIPVINYIFDTQYLQHSIYSESQKDLGYLSSIYNPRHQYWKDGIGSTTWYNYCLYNARDCHNTLVIFINQLNNAPAYAIKNYLLKFKLIFPCVHVNLQGLRVDKGRMEKEAKELEEEAEEILERVRKEVNNKEFNPNSPKQNMRVFEILGAKRAGVKSTDKKNAQKLKETHPLADRIIGHIEEYKKLTKQATFVKTSLLFDRLFFSLNPFGTETGRMACKSGEMYTGTQIQNIPVARRGFVVAENGWVLGSNDMPQSESRCTAYISGDENLINTVEGDKDFHRVNASLFFGLPYEKITKEIRKVAKAVNHGSNYNMGPYVLVETMGRRNVLQAAKLLNLPSNWTTIQIAEHLLSTFSKAYPDIKGKYYKWVIKIALTTHRFTNSFGWTRYTWLNPNRSKHDLNALVAHPPQNLSVEIINKGFYRIWKELALEYPNKFKLYMQIHDEIVYSTRDNKEDKAWAEKEVRERMTIPVQVKDCQGIERTMVIHPDPTKWGYRWNELKD